MSKKRRHVKRNGRKRLIYGVIAVVFIFLCLLTYFFQHQSNQTSSDHETPPQVAIVDQLNFTGQPNPTFVNACEKILDESGLTWKYYRGEDITVNFYRNLTSYGSSLIILRVHSAIMKTPEGAVSILGFFTSERYSPEAAQKYSEDVQDKRLVEAWFNETEREKGMIYFGIVPSFVEKSMIGEFKDAVVIMMGCEGLGYTNITGAHVAYTDMAEAFRKRGAKVCIGWDGPVGVNHTDQATLDLLQSLLIEKQTIKEAVGKVAADPYYKSALKFYPGDTDTGNYVIPNVRISLTMNVAYASPKVLKKSRFIDKKYTTQG